MANNSGGTRSNSSGGAKKTTTTKKPASSKGKSTKQVQNQPRPIRREVGAAVCLFLAVFAFIGYFNVDALFINALSGLLKGLIGWGFYLFPPALILTGLTLFFHRGRPIAFKATSIMLLPVLFGAIGHLLFCRVLFDLTGNFAELIKALYACGKAMEGGGLLSGLISLGLDAMFSVYGAFPVLLAAFLFFLMVGANLSFTKLLNWWNGRERSEYEVVPEPEIKPIPVKETVKLEKKPRRSVIDIPIDDEPEQVDIFATEELKESKELKEAKEPKERANLFSQKPRVKTPAQVLAGFNESDDDAFEEPLVETPPPIEYPIPEIMHIPAEPVKAVQKATRVEVEAETAAVAEEIERAKEKVSSYEFPPIDLLKKGGATSVDGRDEIALNRERLETTLRSFGVAANIVGVTRGPTVTRYDLELDAGVKLTKLTNLSNDLALSLGVLNVRIAPIPDKISTVGIEVPNKIVSIVYLRDVIDSPNFKNASSNLSFAIGKDIAGDCVVGNIAKLPHMLIAGTTGSGKSVCINSLILSLLYKSTPEQVRFIMIDPKMVELGIYNGIPHLFVPVVTDPKKAAGALQWSVVEMLKRYRLFSEVGVRDLAGYNSYQLKNGGETLPQVVIVVDELADLMLVASKDVEESICRVAQMGRASGMHLIIATQRPSADVITGLMKANIPSRIAFAVSSAMESRIILDSQGAEKLVGMGDMLYSPLGIGKPTRVQGAFVSDEEREDIIDFIKRSSAPDYSDDILAQIDKAAEEKPANSGGASSATSAAQNGSPKSNYDDLLPQAVDVIFETKQASVSMLQRRLKLGYSRAARIVDQLEEIGIVGPFEGSKPRQVLITKQQWQEMQNIHGTAPTERFVAEMEFGTDEDEGENEDTL